MADALRRKDNLASLAAKLSVSVYNEMSFNLKPNTRSLFLYGLALPILVEVIAVFAVIVTDSGASAEGFAGILVVIMLIVAMPITLVGNFLLYGSLKSSSWHKVLGYRVHIPSNVIPSNLG